VNQANVLINGQAFTKVAVFDDAGELVPGLGQVLAQGYTNVLINGQTYTKVVLFDGTGAPLDIAP
jgi:hypothetical protein